MILLSPTSTLPLLDPSEFVATHCQHCDDRDQYDDQYHVNHRDCDGVVGESMVMFLKIPRAM